MIGITPARFADELKTAYSVPDGEYERAFWCQEIVYLLKEASGLFGAELKSLLNRIRDEQISSSEFALEKSVKDVRSVDLALLKSELPDVYSSLVYVSSSDVVKFVGGSQKAYKLAREISGSRTDSVELINLKELEDLLTPVEAARYIKCDTQDKGLSVVRL